jgi:hypothetical protein
MRLVGREAQEVRPGGPVTLPPFPFSFCVWCESLWPGVYGFGSGGSDFESRQTIKKGFSRKNSQRPQKMQAQAERCWRWNNGMAARTEHTFITNFNLIFILTLRVTA